MLVFYILNNLWRKLTVFKLNFHLSKTSAHLLRTTLLQAREALLATFSVAQFNLSVDLYGEWRRPRPTDALSFGSTNRSR